MFCAYDHIIHEKAGAGSMESVVMVVLLEGLKTLCGKALLESFDWLSYVLLLIDIMCPTEMLAELY